MKDSPRQPAVGSKHAFGRLNNWDHNAYKKPYLQANPGSEIALENVGTLAWRSHVVEGEVMLKGIELC